MFKSISFVSLILLCSLLPFSTAQSTEAPVPTAPPIPEPTSDNNNNNTVAESDFAILNFALTLEYLEATFYSQGLSRFQLADFQAANFTSNTYYSLVRILNHEATHVLTLVQVIISLGGTPTQNCTFSFNFNNITEFMNLARALEATGVHAYTGAIGQIKNSALVTAAATIATIEARHAAFLNTITNEIPFAGAFDTPLDARSIITVASQFVESCPNDVGIQPYPKLNIAPQRGPINQVITLSTESTDNISLGANSTQCVFLFNAQQKQQPLESDNTCRVPSDVEGQILVYVTNSNSTEVLAGPAFYEVEPVFERFV